MNTTKNELIKVLNNFNGGNVKLAELIFHDYLIQQNSPYKFYFVKINRKLNIIMDRAWIIDNATDLKEYRDCEFIEIDDDSKFLKALIQEFVDNLINDDPNLDQNRLDLIDIIKNGGLKA